MVRDFSPFPLLHFLDSLSFHLLLVHLNHASSEEEEELNGEKKWREEIEMERRGNEQTITDRKSGNTIEGELVSETVDNEHVNW